MSFSALWWRVKVFRSRVINSFNFLIHAPSTYENWLYMIWSRFTSKPGVLKLRNGLKFHIRPKMSDRTTINEMFIMNPYGLNELVHLKPTDCVVDIGANVGAFTVMAAAQTTSGKVIAVEPVPGNFQMLSQNVAINGLKNVSLMQKAAGGSEGEIEIYSAGSQSSLYWGKNSTKEKVRLVTLAGILAENGIGKIDLLKMDCEGAEFDVLFQSSDETLKKVNSIVMEFHNVSAQKHVSHLKDFLNKKGFNARVIGGDRDWCGLLLATTPK